MREYVIVDLMLKGSCGDCGVKVGQKHLKNCDIERCPFCLRQMIGSNHRPDCKYSNGEVTDEELKKAKIPYVPESVLCKLCGCLIRDMFHSDDWNKYITPELQNEVLCKECFDKMKELFPNGWKE